MRSALLILILAAVPAAAAQEPPPPSQDRAVEPADRAITKGLEYLLSRQQATGAIHEPAMPAWQTGMTSLSVMAFLAVGNQPTDQTREGEAMRRGLTFVLRPDRMDATGYFGGPDGSLMYGHGITTLMLAEVMGMGVDADQDRLIRERCQKGVDLILKSQKMAKPDPRMRGGWRYYPNSPDSDLSATVWQLMALRAAKNAEIDVPSDAIDLAVEYIKRSYYSPRGADGKPTIKVSACAYQPGSMPMLADPAAGLLSLQMCGAYDTPEVTGSAEWLRIHRLKYTDLHYFYEMYYFAQGMYQRGGTLADEARTYVVRSLVPLQTPSGAWTGGQWEKAYGDVYTTSLAILALSVKYHFLPIYQR